jgi:hypothetical protein
MPSWYEAGGEAFLALRSVGIVAPAVCKVLSPGWFEEKPPPSHP